MLINRATLSRIESGEIDLAFRRWRRPTVKAGGTLRTAIGLLSIDAVDVIADDDVTEDDARRAGYRDRAELLAGLANREGQLHRIALSPGGIDPRVVLREDAELSDDDLAHVHARFARLDRASPVGPWTAATLRLIAERPGVRAADLAQQLGQERDRFKTNVRKLKALGLTVSLGTGYRLSPRGEAFLPTLVNRGDGRATGVE